MNGEYRGDDDIGKLMHDFCCADPDKMFFKDMAVKAKQFKTDAKGELRVSGILEQMKSEWLNEGIQAGYSEGRSEGVLETKRETAVKMIKAGSFTTEQISEYSGLPESDVEKIRASFLN